MSTSGYIEILQLKSTIDYMKYDAADSCTNRRPRNADATREALILAAKRLFGRNGYDGTGLREIAGEAGVNAALISRYFGSKKGLFSAAIEGTFASLPLHPENKADFGRLVTLLMAAKESHQEDNDLFKMITRASGNSEAEEAIRDAVTTGFLDPMARLIGGPNAQKRAAMIMAILTGGAMLPMLVGRKALQGFDEKAMARYLAPSIQQLIDKD